MAFFHAGDRGIRHGLPGSPVTAPGGGRVVSVIRFSDAGCGGIAMARLATALGRRAWLGLWLAAAGGCSAAKTRPKSRARRAKGPQTMTALLVDGYLADLGGSDRQKRITAARELGVLGSAARKALPALEKLAADKDADLSAAAVQAIAQIRR